MDAERILEPPRRPDRADPPAEVLPTADPDPEFAAAYAAWKLDRPEERR